MASDRSYIAENDTQRQRLRALVEKLTDEQLRQPMAAGWTIASVLAHLAFWDQRILVLLEHWEQGKAPRSHNAEDVNWINDAAKALCLALPPRVAAQLALATADVVDRKVEALPDTRLAANEAAGHPLNLLRAQHRREHLDEIEHALGR
jgi:uncharacterized damage-inducible protein DinB